MSIYFLQYLNNKHSYTIDTRWKLQYVIQDLILKASYLDSQPHWRGESILHTQVEQSVTRSFQLFLKIKIHKKKKFFKKCFECCLSSNSHYTFLHICPFVTRFVIFLEICRRKLCLNPNSKNSKFKFLYL